jgi:hypothetical protein
VGLGRAIAAKGGKAEATWRNRMPGATKIKRVHPQWVHVESVDKRY